MIKLVIFDWDDVFTTNSIAGYYKCYHTALEGIGLQLEPAEEDELIKARWGAGHKAQLEYILAKKGRPAQQLQQALKLYEQAFYGGVFIDCLGVVPGAQAFLQDIAQRYTLAIATGGDPKILKEQYMPKFRIPDVFARIITIYDLDDLKHAKPHPFMAQKIMAELGVEPKQTVLVGDAATDMEMARNAGVTPIAVLTGHLTRQEAEALGVDYIINDVTRLEPVLRKLA